MLNNAQAFHQLAQSRHSVRSFSPLPIATETIEAILATAHTAPYVSGRKNWDVLVVTDPQILAQMANCVTDAAEQISHKVTDNYREHFLQYAQNFLAFASAPAVLVPVFRVAPSLSAMLATPDHAIESYERDNNVKSIACVSMLLLLAAQSHGLGSVFMTGPLLAHQQLLSLLPVPKGREIAALIPIGYPTTSSSSRENHVRN